jgi:uncharacterized membrane protein
MSTLSKLFKLIFPLLAGFMAVGIHTGRADEEITLYTPYTKISVPPGETINYTIDVINKSEGVRNVDVSLAGLPGNWHYDMKSEGWNIGKIAVLPGKEKSFTLNVQVPLKVEKGNYRFRLVAGKLATLPITINVSEKGTFKTEFTTEQPNMEGHADASFTFNAELKNYTADKQLYSLKSGLRRGWDVTFKVNYKQVTSVNLEPNSTKDITIEVDPPDRIQAGTYKIPIKAVTNTSSAKLNLEVVITGSYDMELTTSSGRLNTDIIAGDDKKVKILVKNTGSAALENIKLDYSAPTNWEVTFKPEKVDDLNPGKSASVIATLAASKKAIAGDYITSITAQTPEAGAKTKLRITVKTPMLWGWIGVLIILIALGGVFYLFRKYGRR